MSEQRPSEQPGKPEMPANDSTASAGTGDSSATTGPESSPVRAYTPRKATVPVDSTEKQGVVGSSSADVPASAGGGVGAGGTERPAGQAAAPVGSAQGAAGPTTGPTTDPPATAPLASAASSAASAPGTATSRSASAASGRADTAVGDRVVGDLGWAGGAADVDVDGETGDNRARARAMLGSARSMAESLPTERVSGVLGAIEAMIRDRPVVATVLALFTGFLLGRITRD